jgi:hypothetical protein
VNDWDALRENTRLELVRVGATTFRTGERVRLRPRGGGDIFDLALDGKIATIESIEQDLEDRIYIVVTVDDDPGKEFGDLRRPGHRFFFTPDEVEPLGEQR